MRRVTFGMNISIDGYCDHTIFNPSKELHDYFTGMMDDVDLLFFGRVMYQLMFPYWADVAKNQSGTGYENRFAEKLTSIDKVVISRSLSNAEENTRIIRSNPAEELRKLKQQPGKKISVDSVSMLPELIEAGLIDEFRLVVHPVIVGNGRKLLDAGSLQEKLNLTLTDTIIFKSGSVAHHYLKQ
ncbi:dihydrofolate reductase family protein [Mucilaginibacter sabulilitoris]|uniref:Dihydrofolate reductase family protein n=1 Tax=Mucilaginibacter sabulilitoris TaxID=1173583 RepID=A0ABZ0TYH8_9SPHI|nr:dihydrofolate reductase family protein [Mucilaginibacter sabulilitoris]WPU96175.1 dihydrofolate reductase family protein [Mucilaginibacter sabulilitoris]